VLLDFSGPITAAVHAAICATSHPVPALQVAARDVAELGVADVVDAAAAFTGDDVAGVDGEADVDTPGR
jgi:hypothetical protein